MTQHTGDTVAVLDLGSQYSHLIVRRLRELGAYAELLPPETSAQSLEGYAAIVLSGGPQNLSESDALRVDSSLFELGKPILGICYGMQLIADELGGVVERKDDHEYGSTEVETFDSVLFKDGGKKEKTWMSHGDQVTEVPDGFSVTGKSDASPIAAIENVEKNIFALQFHPEVSHTENGTHILENFLNHAKVARNWKLDEAWIESAVQKIRTQVGDKKALCALSGGVDSAVAAYLVHRAIGDQLTCVYVDTGLMRLRETEGIEEAFSTLEGLTLHVAHKEDEFLKKLAGVTDPEEKRKRIGETFIRVFEEEAKKLGSIEFLVQGTLYTDVITSGVSIGGKAAKIKSHHNVGGLPEDMQFELVEPLRDLYKDEVRSLGRALGVPESIITRQPFPGPGLAVRIIGEVTKERLDMLRKADAIFREEMLSSGAAEDAQQYFAVLPNIRSVGVQGDARTYGHPIILRAVSTNDFMTADWTRIDHETLARISNRITNEVEGVNRVAYDITSKPPGTVEWE